MNADAQSARSSVRKILLMERISIAGRVGGRSDRRLSYAVGYGRLELPAASVCGSTELERLVSIARAVPRDARANLVEVARLMADCDVDSQFGLGLDLIISGLEVRLEGEIRT